MEADRLFSRKERPLIFRICRLELSRFWVYTKVSKVLDFRMTSLRGVSGSDPRDRALPRRFPKVQTQTDFGFIPALGINCFSNFTNPFAL